MKMRCLIAVGVVLCLMPLLAATGAEKALPTWAEGAVLAFSFEDDTLSEDHEETVQVRDLSDSGSRGEFVALQTLEGKVGRGLDFGGEDDVWTALGHDPACSWSIAVWVYPYELENFDEEVDDMGLGHSIVNADAPDEGGLGIGIDADEIRMMTPSEEGWITGKAFPVAFKTEAWQHIAVVVDADTGNIAAYVHGKKIGTKKVELDKEAPMGNRFFHLGFRPDVWNRPFHGRLDEVAIWNRALTAAEVESLHTSSNAGKSYCEVIAEAAKTRAMPKFQGHYYRLIHHEWGWHEAKHYCQSVGGHLACVESAAENQFLAKLALGRQVWLGATDEATEGEWKWVNEQPFAYSNWAEEEPNNDGGIEHYLHTNAEGHGLWNDFRADPEGVTGFLCEWEIKFGTYLAVSPTAAAKFTLAQDGTFSIGERNGSWQFRDGAITLTFADGGQHKLKMLNSGIFSNNKGLTLVRQGH